jgi:hypothetical protein
MSKTPPRSLANNMEMTVQKNLLTILFISLVAALTAQSAAASEHHHAQAKNRQVMSEAFRNSNAFAAPADIASQSRLSAYADGAMASGIAGH